MRIKLPPFRLQLVLWAAATAAAAAVALFCSGSSSARAARAARQPDDSLALAPDALQLPAAWASEAPAAVSEARKLYCAECLTSCRSIGFSSRPREEYSNAQGPVAGAVGVEASAQCQCQSIFSLKEGRLVCKNMSRAASEARSSEQSGATATKAQTPAKAAIAAKASAKAAGAANAPAKKQAAPTRTES